MVFGNSCNFWYHQGRLTCYLDSPQFSVLWEVVWCHVNVIYISWRFVSCHLILSNLITLCSYVMHFRSRGAIERQSNTQWPTWDDTQTLPSLNIPGVTMWAQQLVYTNTTVVARSRPCASIYNLRSHELSKPRDLMSKWFYLKCDRCFDSIAADDFIQISQRLGNLKSASRCSEILRDLVVRHLTA